MATLTLRGLAQTVQDAAAAAQGACATALDFTVGSALLAIMEAHASAVLWLQYVALQVLASTRLATSSGADVDSFVGDFGVARLPAVAATGAVTLSRYTATAPAVVAPGAQLKSADLTQAFTVTTDITNPLWTPASAAYVIPAGTASATVPVQAATPGSAGNAQAGTITVLATALAGVDTATNAAPLVNGRDAETDAALRARFGLFLGGLSKGTAAAIGSAVAGVQQGLTYVLQAGTPAAGAFTLTVDDGSGNPPAATLAAVYKAVDAVRAVGTIFAVQAPTPFPVAISTVLSLPSGVVRAPVVATVNAAISAYLATLAVGQTVYYGAVYQAILNASPLIISATLMLNGGAADIVAPPTGKAAVSTVSVA